MFIRKKKLTELEDTIKGLQRKLDSLMRHDLIQRVSSLERSVEEQLAEMEGYKSYKTEKDLLKESDEPWADFETTIDENGRVKVTMDWNKPFIEMLKKNGIKANNEEDMVSVYFSSLVREAGDELTEEQVAKMNG